MRNRSRSAHKEDMSNPKDQPKRSKRTHLWIAAVVAVAVHGAVVLTLLLTERPESAEGDFTAIGGNENRNGQLDLSLLPPEQIAEPSAAQQWVSRQGGDGSSLGPPPRTPPPARTALRGEAMNSAGRKLRESAEPALKRGGLTHAGARINCLPPRSDMLNRLPNELSVEVCPCQRFPY